MCTRYPIINRVSELKVHIELTRFVQPEKSKLMQTKGQLMKSLNTAFSFAPPSILSLTILMFLLYHNDTIMKNEKIVHGLYAKNNKKVYLKKATCICYNGGS